jgi:hypothetical protein
VAAATTTPNINVYKSPTCGCCGNWVEHLRSSGLKVAVNDIADIDAFRAKAGVPAALASCHTALVDGYVVEGQVPAADIRKLLADRPNALGLAVPGCRLARPGWTVLARVATTCCCSMPEERRVFTTRTRKRETCASEDPSR